MPWQAITIRNDETGVLLRRFQNTARFLVDRNLRLRFSSSLLGYNVTDVFTLKLGSGTREDVYAAASRQRRILLTSERDFLDDHKFPPGPNACIVVLPANNNDVLMSALMSALSLIVVGRGLRDGVKVLVGENGEKQPIQWCNPTGENEHACQEIAHHVRWWRRDLSGMGNRNDQPGTAG